MAIRGKGSEGDKVKEMENEGEKSILKLKKTCKMRGRQRVRERERKKESFDDHRELCKLGKKQQGRNLKIKMRSAQKDDKGNEEVE